MSVMNEEINVELSTGDSGTQPLLKHEATNHQCNGVLHRSKSITAGSPDRLTPATDIKVWARDGAVKLRMEKVGPGAEKPISVVTYVREAARKYGDSLALAHKIDGKWEKITYTEYYNLIIKAAKSFIKLGLERLKGVGIIGFNSPEWFVADLGAIFAGGLATGIYTTNSAEACEVIAASAECNIVVVENDQQLKKFLQIRDNLPHLKAIVQYKGRPTAKDVYSWEDFLAAGEDVTDEALEERINEQSPNKCCTLIYTSGTAGSPKAVMLSHDNLVWTALAMGRTVRWRERDAELLVSYLPLSHIAAQLIDIYLSLGYGTPVYFAKPDALRGSLGETLQEAHPTGFAGVPRVWEKIQEKMIEKGRSNSYIKRLIANWAKNVGRRGNMALMKGEPLPWGWTLAKYLVFDKVRDALGLQDARYAVSCAAPIMKDTLEFFMSLDVPLLEVFGLSETTGPHTFSVPWAWRLTSVGKNMDGCFSKLSDVDRDGCGELCLQGRNTFMGYMNDEEMTRTSIDEDGWFHSGDLGRIDSDGYVYVTGRLKELLITAGGENVAPIPIEERIKQQLPCINNCMLVGDKLKFLSVLLTLKTVIDEETQEPTDELTPAVVQWCQSVGSDARTVTDIIDKKDAPVLEAIEAGISRANEKAISRAQIVQKWTILPQDFTLSGGELGPTMKLKRRVVLSKYARTIEALYAE